MHIVQTILFLSAKVGLMYHMALDYLDMSFSPLDWLLWNTWLRVDKQEQENKPNSVVNSKDGCVGMHVPESNYSCTSA